MLKAVELEHYYVEFQPMCCDVRVRAIDRMFSHGVASLSQTIATHR